MPRSALDPCRGGELAGWSTCSALPLLPSISQFIDPTVISQQLHSPTTISTRTPCLHYRDTHVMTRREQWKNVIDVIDVTDAGRLLDSVHTERQLRFQSLVLR